MKRQVSWALLAAGAAVAVAAATAAAGRFTATVTGRGVLPRNRDGSCDSSRDPLHEVDMITATGTLSF